MALFVAGNYTLLEVRTHQSVEKIAVLNTQDLKVEGTLLSKSNLSHILSGDLSFSKIFDSIPLSDPFATLQLFVAGGSTIDAKLEQANKSVAKQIKLTYKNRGK